MVFTVEPETLEGWTESEKRPSATQSLFNLPSPYAFFSVERLVHFMDRLWQRETEWTLARREEAGRGGVGVPNSWLRDVLLDRM